MPRLSLLLACGIAFALAHGQAALYYSNQNQYFLQGLADAGAGLLADDWLANTADPTPLFSGLVAATARWLHPWAFHLYYALLHCVYLAGLAGIYRFLAGERDGLAPSLVFLSLIVLTHAAATRWASQRLFGLDYPWYLQAGVAGQYLLGAMFQPSTCGVLLLAALALFLQRRPWSAAAGLCIAATVHSTYLLPAALLTCGFLWVLWSEGKGVQAALLGAACLAGVTPVVIYAFVMFQPTSPAAFAEAQHILVHFRIPHHCLPELWLDGIALFQIGWMVFAVLLCRGTRLFPLLAIPLLLAAALTLLQVMTQSDTLALLFPWRVSAVLMPVATAVVLTRIVRAADGWIEGKAVPWAAGGVIGLLAAAGVLLMQQRAGYQTPPDEEALMVWVWHNKKKGDVYLTPATLPNLKASVRGSFSSDFRPQKVKQHDERLIPGDLQRFRLHALAPIYVDFKAIPYRDTEVLQWRARLARAAGFYRRLDASGFSDAMELLDGSGVTHLILPADREVSDPAVRKRYDDGKYAVYELPAPA